MQDWRYILGLTNVPQNLLKDKHQVQQKEVYYFSRERIILAAKLLAVSVEVTALLMPVFLLALVEMTMVVTLITVLLFVLAFAALMSLSTGAKAENVFIGTCT